MASSALRMTGVAVRGRRVLLLLPALGAACAGPEPASAPPLGPMSWAHLTPLPLDVASLEVAPSSPPPPPGDVGALLSTPPAEAVRAMARDRLSAVGTTGQAVFLVTEAGVVRERGGALRCALGCRLEITGGEGGPGFMEAAVQRSVSGAEASGPRAADLLLRRAMDDLNVEFEYQLRRNLRRWLVSAAPAGAAVAPPVGREELPPARGGAAGRPSPPTRSTDPEE
jgi:hypothetical protein